MRKEGRVMIFKRHFRFYFLVGAGLLLVLPSTSQAIFGVGDEVFDPTMYASQLRQLQQETATVTNLAQQLQYAIKNTTSGGAGAWQSNQNLLANLGGLIFGAAGAVLYFSGARPAVSAALSRLQRNHHDRGAKPTGERRHHSQYLER